MIKVVHIITSLEVGGAQQVLYNIITGLNTSIYQHHICYFRAGPYVDDFRRKNIPLYHVQGIIHVYDPLLWIRLYRLLRKLQPDLIHSVLWSANVISRIVGRLLALPLVTTYHNNVKQNTRIRLYGDKISHKIYPSTRVAVSEEVKKSLQQCDATASSIQVIVNGVDEHMVYTHAIREKKNKKELGFKEHHIVIGSVGRLVSVKRYELLIEAIARVIVLIPHVRLVLVGDGPEEKTLKKLIEYKNLAPYVHIISGQRAYGYYSLFDCFVQCSDEEGISIALLEALTLGIPVIVASKDAYHSVIEHEKNGFIFSAGNSNALVQTLIKLIQDENKKGAVKEGGKQSIRDCFNLYNMCAQYDTLFKNRGDRLHS